MELRLASNPKQIPQAQAGQAQVRHEQAGFTLVELMVVIGLAAVFFAFTVVVGLDSYRGDGFRSERDSIVTALQTARSQAINNVCSGSGCNGGKPHGVAISGGNYIIFQGSSYAGRDAAFDQIIGSRYTVNFIGSTVSEVVFTQLSGDASPAGTIKINDPARPGSTSTVSINSVGQISWTN